MTTPQLDKNGLWQKYTDLAQKAGVDLNANKDDEQAAWLSEFLEIQS